MTQADTPQYNSHQSSGTAGSNRPPGSATVTALPVTLADVRAARERIMPHLHRTPTLPTATLSHRTGTNLSIKCETFQRTGSFKARGALNAVLQLSPEQRERGVVTLSAGNHGQGLAFAASKVGTRAVVFMPETAVPAKVDAMRAYGAETMFAPGMETLYAAMEAYKEEQGLTFVPPFSDRAIIAGQGVVGLEIVEDVPDVETIVVPVGGGGLLAGILVAVKQQRPDIRVVGVEPVGANVVQRSRDERRLITAEHIDTVADGLTAPFAGDVSQPIIEELVDDLVLVSDEEIVAALQLIIERCKIVVEPAGAAATAALMSGKIPEARGTRTVSLLSGGNIDLGKLAAFLS